jgi:hypothetical protein
MKKVRVYNPLNDDFTVMFDVTGKSNPVEFRVPAREVETFEKKVADHVKKHLINELINRKGSKPNAEVAKERYMNEISIDLWEESDDEYEFE